MNTLLPADETFPKTVRHIANRDLELEVVWYAAESAPYGGVPVVAKGNGTWYAGEGIILDGEPVLAAVNGYGDEATAKQYAKSIYTVGG